MLSADIDHYHYPERNQQYLGYSIEKRCRNHTIVPLKDRPNHVWLFAKEIAYLHVETFAWNLSYFTVLYEKTGIATVGGWNLNQHYMWDPEELGEMADIADPEHGVVNLGHLDRPSFGRALGSSRALVGVGGPALSPSPYDALCRVSAPLHDYLLIHTKFFYPIREFRSSTL